MLVDGSHPAATREHGRTGRRQSHDCPWSGTVTAARVLFVAPEPPRRSSTLEDGLLDVVIAGLPFVAGMRRR